MESEISAHPEAGHVLDGLNAPQRKQLAALLFDIIDSMRACRTYKTSARRVHKLSATRIRSLNKRVAKVRQSLEALQDYSRRLDPALPIAMVVTACLRMFSIFPVGEDPEFYEAIKSEYPSIEEPVALGMVQLYFFFLHGCGLPGREAEVRVALIRNAFWKKHGVSAVPFRTKYKTGESRGCNAVHAAVQRFQQGTSRQINR
jgi:hypothetical protein